MKILVIAPHPDDEVLGCGGIISKYAKEKNDVYVCIVTKGYAPLFNEEEDEKDKIECLKAHDFLGVKETFFLDLPAAELDKISKVEINSKIGEVINKINPDEVYIPFRGDIHLDHKLISDASMVGLRPRGEKKVKRIYAYETLSETGWDIPNSENVFIPNTYVDIENDLENKIQAMSIYKNQVCDYPSPRSIEGIKALAIYRGTTVSLKYAESFILYREIK